MRRLIPSLIPILVVLAGCSGGHEGYKAWPVPIETRVYSGAFSREPEVRRIGTVGLAGEYVSAQVAVTGKDGIKALRGSLSELRSESGSTIPASCVRVRYGAYVPVDETMNMTADPLLETASVDVPANRAQPVWLTVAVPGDAAAGLYEAKFSLSSAGGEGPVFDFALEVLPARLPEPPDWSFYLNIWQDPNGVARAHDVPAWSEEHWTLLERHAANFGEHGLKSIMTSLVHDPWKGQSGYTFDTMVEWQYPGEWTAGEAGKFTWDFSRFDRYVSLMMDAGVRDKIDMYALVMGPGGTLDAHIRYLDTESGQYRTAQMQVGEPMWKEAWSAFLPVLREHLKQKGWFDVAVLGFDEKTPKVMKVIFDYLIETAPDFKVAMSGGFPGDERKWGDEIVYHIDDIRSPERWEAVRPMVERMHADPDRFVSFYTACWPHFPNTFIFSSLRESRLMAWLAWKYGFDGYTRWAVNAYPENVWEQPRYRWPSGDMFFVYPGPDGPLDSMRWELLRQGIQDYEALRIAWQAAENAGRADLLAKLRRAVDAGAMIEACFRLPPISEGREAVDEVLRELAPGG